MRFRSDAAILMLRVLLLLSSRGHGFQTPPPVSIRTIHHDPYRRLASLPLVTTTIRDKSADLRMLRLYSTSSSSRSSTTTQLPEIDTMRAGQIKQELESYGISTKSFLEKSELVSALEKARAQGLQPTKVTTASASSTSSSTSTGSATGGSSSSSSTQKSREEQLAEEMVKCQSMKASELKKELQDRGISTAALFEKSEFVRAVAEARVDNVSRRSSTSADDTSSEGYAEYKNVEVLTDDSAGPRQRKEQQQQSTGSPFGSGANPFGGGGSPFGGAAGNPFGAGGMSGMGGIADMLKNMGMGGMGGVGGANPFGGSGSPFGGGANPFAGGGGAGMSDVMGKAQELMKNPKVRDLMQRAQSNPRIMAKVNECMSNPASFAKYQNDPDVKELIDELRKLV